MICTDMEDSCCFLTEQNGNKPPCVLGSLGLECIVTRKIKAALTLLTDESFLNEVSRPDFQDVQWARAGLNESGFIIVMILQNKCRQSYVEPVNRGTLS